VIVVELSTKGKLVLQATVTFTGTCLEKEYTEKDRSSSKNWFLGILCGFVVVDSGDTAG
jgi:hypothetical protein